MRVILISLLIVVLIITLYVAEVECKKSKSVKAKGVSGKISKQIKVEALDKSKVSGSKVKKSKSKKSKKVKKNKSRDILLENVGEGVEKLNSMHEREFVEFRNKIVKIFGEAPVVDSIRYAKYPTGFRPLDEILGIGYALISHGRFNGMLYVSVNVSYIYVINIFE